MIEQTNLIVGTAIIIINLVPFITKKYNYLQLTIPLSLLIGAIKFFFFK